MVDKVWYNTRREVRRPRLAKHMKGVAMGTRSRGLPNEVVKKFAVGVTKPRTQDKLTSDGQHNPDGLFGGGGDNLTTEEAHNGTMRRVDPRFSLQLEWVDFNEQGHRIELPHELLQRIFDVHNRIIDESKSDRATRAMETRMRNGYVPHFPSKK